MPKLKQAIVKHNITSPKLIVNWDQVSLALNMNRHHTLAERGSSSVRLTGHDDKRNVTVCLACAADGTLLPPQIIYTGTTINCLPDFDFPIDWSLAFNSTHWSTAENVIEFIDGIVVPYFHQVWHSLGLSKDNAEIIGIVVFDAFAAQCTDDVTEHLKNQKILHVLVPAGYTDYLQPLDVCGNRSLKAKIVSVKEAHTVERFIETLTKDIDDMNLDDYCELLKFENQPFKELKCDAARWLLEAHTELQKNKFVFQKGWEHSGLSKVIDEGLKKARKRAREIDEYDIEQIDD